MLKFCASTVVKNKCEMMDTDELCSSEESMDVPSVFTYIEILRVVFTTDVC